MGWWKGKLKSEKKKIYDHENKRRAIVLGGKIRTDRYNLVEEAFWKYRYNPFV